MIVYDCLKIYYLSRECRRYVVMNVYGTDLVGGGGVGKGKSAAFKNSPLGRVYT